MQKNLSNKELVAAGHKFAANISADTPLLDMAKMVSELATQLDVALAAAAEAGKQRGAVMKNLAEMEDKLRIKQNHIKLRDTYIEELEQRAEAAEACTNSLTNAQEALKSAGIEADTVQAGVMELVSRMNRVAAENYDLKHPGTYLPSKRETPATEACLNAVRADAVVTAAAHLGDIASGKSTSTAELIKSCGRALLAYAAQLRAGNAGKDGV